MRYDKIIWVLWRRCSLFGYIRVDRANLLGKEYEAYKGVYCALCKQLGRDYSLFARFILSYDCTFYAMLILSLAEESPCYTQGRCRFNPMKKCAYANTDTPAYEMAAALSVSSAYYKLRDNLIDSPWYKRFLYRLAQPIFSRWHKKSRSKYPAIDRAVEEMLYAQLDAEASPDVSLDAAAEPTAKMLSSVCGLIPDAVTLKSGDPAKVKRILSAFGYYVGRWIYLIDAADDFEKDIKHHGFNPLRPLMQDPAELKAVMIPVLNHSLSEALLSYGLLEPGRYDSIILNVLKSSCVNIQNTITDRYVDHENGDKV